MLNPRDALRLIAEHNLEVEAAPGLSSGSYRLCVRLTRDGDGPWHALQAM
jgi:hypothetical protein